MSKSGLFAHFANLQFVARRSSEPIERARKALERRLAAAVSG